MIGSAGFGLYVHWPWCQAKCPYCDFNSHVTAAIPQDNWAAAYEGEIRRVATETGPRRLRSIFFGGGTPSLMAPSVVARVIAAADAAWGLEPDAEITLEANPTSVEAQNLAGFRTAGVNRVSLGVQALNDGDLRALGRLHSAAEALNAVALARRLFGRVSLDLIYSRQHQTLPAWQAELEQALDLGMDHLSLYQLTIEDGTAFGARAAAGKLPGLPDEDLSLEMFEFTQARMAAAGLPAYEISNHARPGAEGQHNLIYWRSGDWAGIGPGAHGRLTLEGRRWATETLKDPLAWLAAARRGSGETVQEALSPLAVTEERVLMGLRLTEGLDLSAVEQSHRVFIDSNISRLQAEGLIWRRNGLAGVTARGRPLLNAVVAEVLRGLTP